MTDFADWCLVAPLAWEACASMSPLAADEESARIRARAEWETKLLSFGGLVLEALARREGIFVDVFVSEWYRLKTGGEARPKLDREHAIDWELGRRGLVRWQKLASSYRVLGDAAKLKDAEEHCRSIREALDNLASRAKL